VLEGKDVHRWLSNIAHFTAESTARTTGALMYVDTVKSGNANRLRVWNSLSKIVLATWRLSAKDAGGFTLTVASENLFGSYAV
jgi:hypothetical protein